MSLVPNRSTFVIRWIVTRTVHRKVTCWFDHLYWWQLMSEKSRIPRKSEVRSKARRMKVRDLQIYTKIGLTCCKFYAEMIIFCSLPCNIPSPTPSCSSSPVSFFSQFVQLGFADSIHFPALALLTHNLLRPSVSVVLETARADILFYCLILSHLLQHTVIA